MTNIYFASIEMNDGYKATLLAADIEHNPVTHSVRRGENGSQFTEITKGSVPHDFEPAG